MRQSAVGDACQGWFDEDMSWETKRREYLGELIGVD